MSQLYFACMRSKSVVIENGIGLNSRTYGRWGVCRITSIDGIRWYVAYPLSYRHLEEIMEERGVSVDHSSINRWAIRFLPLIEKIARKHKRPVGGSWRMDETYIKVGRLEIPLPCCRQAGKHRRLSINGKA